MKAILSLIFILLISACNSPKQTEKVTWDKIEKAIQETKISKDQSPPEIQHSFGNVKFIYSRLTDPYPLGLYQKLEVKINDSIQYTLESKSLELEGKNLKYSPDFIYFKDSIQYFLITANNRPEPNFYFIFKYNGFNISLIGKTKPLTKEVFGDIDNDGFLEIGGFTIHCQVNDIENNNNNKSCLDNFEVYEVKDEIKRDYEAEKQEKEKLRHI